MDVFLDWRWMMTPFLACLILAISHVYMGVHVVARKVIFVDLALAQIAAVGATYAATLGYDADNGSDVVAIALFSLAFTFAGAALFSLARMRGEKVPQEAFIGIMYATASAAAILILSKSPTGGEELRQMLVGDILLVSGRALVNIAIIYSLVGIFQVVCRTRFFAISLDSEAAAREGINVRLWDFLFYMTLGVLVTQSVAIAGVLLVFSYLVIPAVIGQMWCASIGRRLGVGWAVAILGSVGGILWSFYSDYPTGPAVVISLSACLVVSALAYNVTSSEHRIRAIGGVALFVVLGVVFVGGLRQFEKTPPEQAPTTTSRTDLLLEELGHDEVAGQLDAIRNLVGDEDPRVVPALAELLEATPSEQVVEAIAEFLAGRQDALGLTALHEASERDYDSFLKLTIAEALIESRDRYGYEVLVGVLRDEEAGFARTQAIELIRAEAGEDFGYASELDVAENESALNLIESWVQDSP
jgi:zinc/manganese transport system permease protein